MALYSQFWYQKLKVELIQQGMSLQLMVTATLVVNNSLNVTFVFIYRPLSMSPTQVLHLVNFFISKNFIWFFTSNAILIWSAIIYISVGASIRYWFVKLSLRKDMQQNIKRKQFLYICFFIPKVKKRVQNDMKKKKNI